MRCDRSELSGTVILTIPSSFQVVYCTVSLELTRLHELGFWATRGGGGDRPGGAVGTIGGDVRGGSRPALLGDGGGGGDRPGSAARGLARPAEPPGAEPGAVALSHDERLERAVGAERGRRTRAPHRIGEHGDGARAQRHRLGGRRRDDDGSAAADGERLVDRPRVCI